MTIRIPKGVVFGALGAFTLGSAALVAQQWGDLKRYLKIERM